MQIRRLKGVPGERKAFVSRTEKPVQRIVILNNNVYGTIDN